MAEIGKGYVQIIPTAEGISGKISELFEPETKRAGDEGGKNIVSGIKSALVKLGVGAAVGKVIKDSLDAGGALQQSFGGLETLYGDAADAAKKFAMQAASAGIDANTYAEQAVSFGAALKQAFEGAENAEELAANAANTAIMDMADNAAKMGTDIGAIQTAYQGFAKQNYTMLDNLKLGYGGTKQEMERLLADATKLSGVKYDLDNLGDVYEAIHVIQEDLGLTGVAAAEASETLTGSAGAVKAAFQNVLASMSTGMDMTEPLTQLVTSSSRFMFNNFIPMLGNIITSIPGALSTAIPLVIDQITTQATNLLNGQSAMQFFKSGASILTALLTGMISNIPALITTAGTMITSFVGSIMSSLPTILMVGVGMTMNLVSGVLNNLPAMISSAAQVIAGFLAEVASHLPELLQEGITLLGEVASGIVEAIPDLVGKIPEVISGIVGAFKEYDWLSIGKDILTGIGEGIKSAVSNLVDSAKTAAGALVDGVKGMFKIGSPSKLMADEVGQWIPAGIAKGIMDNIDVVTSAMNDVEDSIRTNSTATVINSKFTPGETYSMTDNLIRIMDSRNQKVAVNVTLQGDTANLFKVVKQEDKKFKTRTGSSRFAY